jgi:hypothetical protein
LSFTLGSAWSSLLVDLLLLNWGFLLFGSRGGLLLNLLFGLLFSFFSFGLHLVDQRKWIDIFNFIT